MNIYCPAKEKGELYVIPDLPEHLFCTHHTPHWSAPVGKQSPKKKHPDLALGLLRKMYQLKPGNRAKI